MFSFKGNLFFILDSGLNIYYTNNFSSISKFKSKGSGLAFNNYYASKNVMVFVYNNGNNYSVGYTDKLVDTNRINTINSLYDWLLTKPEYSEITINATLDGTTIGNFVNNGKIQYDNDEQEFSLDIQNSLTTLQNKTYKKYFDSGNVGEISLFDVLNEIVLLFDNPNWDSTKISQSTKTYLEGVKVKYPYIEENSIWEQLNKICEVGQLVIYPSGTKINIERWV
jgi:hypothetical protein